MMSASLLHVPDTFSQTGEGGFPPSFGYDQSPALRSAVDKIRVPVDFYIKDLREVDNWRAREGVPVPVAQLVKVDYTPDNSGSRTTLPGGERIWRLHLEAPGAVAVMLYYRDFYIPAGGKLFIYSADKSRLLGAYTENTHPSGGVFATEFIGGDELVLEYVEPETGSEKPRIHIDNIGYGYNTSALETFLGITTRASSGECMVNINCEEGDAWQNEKKGVCHTVQTIGDKSYICTGTLMNNTAEDFKPLILTARHCASDGSSTVADSTNMAQWLFYFHKEREGCGNDSFSGIIKTKVGCKLLVNTGMEGGSDGMLLLLNEEIPESYDVFYNGWYRGDAPASSGTCIHHPNGDYKKISTYRTPAQNYTFMSSEFTGYRNAHWNVTFHETANGFGITEGGSSGSPLYNENKLVVGTLTGGSSTCSYPKGLNIYGKMSHHWNKFPADSAHMDIWLDPTFSGVEALAGRFRKVFKPAPTGLRAVKQGQSISLDWNAPNGTEHPEHYNIYRYNQKIGEKTSLAFTDEEPLTGNLLYSVSAVYEGGEESPFVSTTISYVKFKAPADLKAERIDNTENVKLSWNAPVYEQVIYWGTLEPEYMVGFNESIPFYYGQKWSREEISPLNGKFIREVRFLPREKCTYEVYISQGDYAYRQEIDPSSLDYRKINAIVLNEPFVIDGSRSLIVSIYISNTGEGYPAICDAGPAVDGKGNLYSFDGENWERYYDDDDPDEYNYNFVLSALVTSESGILDGDAGKDSGKLVLKYEAGVPESRSGTLKRSSEIPGNVAAVSRNRSRLATTLLPRSAKRQVAEIPVNEQPVSLRSSVPAAFPEITKYRLYRNGSVHRNLSPSETVHMEKAALNADYRYEVSAFYGDVESEKSNSVNVTVGVETVNDEVNISPTLFSGFVSLKGFVSVVRVDVISVSGKICRVVNNPDEIIDTSSLSPGLYFFRIYGRDNRILKVVRAVKTP
ncbi:MAG: T9SS type A sorting domain-containing protein [Tannerella sp.]|jgi:hypothetical protein|nr:T9SS type A sorting domain-containing protein [Tannerella sp.]